MRFSHLSGCSLLVLALSLPATLRAQSAATPPAVPPATSPATSDAFHAPTPAEIVITAPLGRERQDLISGVSVLAGTDLAQAIRPTIGETLARTPGVSSTSFGPNASRPVLRGLQGERVRVLTDGVGSIDVSNTSVDHAVAINPLLAERIEVLRGPESLLYGAAAIGGVVNVIDKRIPRSVPQEAVHVDAIATFASAARERSGSGAVDAPIGGHFVVHADGSYTRTDDLRIGDYVLSPSARAAALTASRLPAAQQIDANGEPLDFAGAAALRGRLPNSASKTWTAGAGAAYVDGPTNIGLSYSRYDSVYGIPIRYATEPGQAQEAPRLDMKQDRFDARAEIQTGGGFIEQVRARAAYAKYRHFELQDDGSIGTAFYNKGAEARLELTQAKLGAWKGASGGQFVSRNFDVVGDEAFLPKNLTTQYGLFTVQQLDYGALKLEAGTRYEHQEVESRARPGQDQFIRGDRDDDTVSGSAGLSYAFTTGWRIGANFSRTERAPSAEELLANGAHAGTEAYELGNPDLRNERAVGLEGVLRGRGKGYTVEASIYHNWFSNFIYDAQVDPAVCEAAAIGSVDLPCFSTSQAKARYYGFELQGTLDVATIGSFSVAVDGLGDYVHAQISGFGPAPRIPPLRLLGGIGATSSLVDARVEVEWTDSQKRLADLETPTASFTMVNAEVNVRPWGTERPLTLALSANNIFDVDARRHASFLKDFAPLAGRDFRVTARVSF